MRTDPLWFVFKMKQAQIREIEMYMKPLGVLDKGTPIKTKYKIPEHLRRNKRNERRSKRAGENTINSCFTIN